MRIDGLQYSKGESSRTIKDDGRFPDVASDESVDIPGAGAESTDYTKGEPYLSTRMIFILSGGSKREKDYFKPLSADRLIHSVKLAFRPKKGQGLKPFELKRLAEEFIRDKCFITEDNSSFHIEEEDIIYLLQDVDEFSEELFGYLRYQSDNDPYRWIISNPSFEIWLFYHYFDHPKSLEAGIDMTERDRSNWLKEHLNTVVPGGIKPSQAFYKAEQAIQNSKKNYAENDRFPALYSTQMHMVAESILDSMNEEFHQMKLRRASRMEYYKNLNPLRK